MPARYRCHTTSALCAAAAVAALLLGASPARAQEQLPAKFADDPVAKALGPAIFNAALKEGTVVWYGSDTSEEFLKHGGLERFEKRFGIKVQKVSATLRVMTDRIRTENAVKKNVGDMFEGNDQYMSELNDLGILAKWKPPAPELDRFNPVVFPRESTGTWWPVHLSAQGIVVNPRYVKPEEITSYWDIVNPKYAGKVTIRDPRSANGGAWHMLGIYDTPGLGIDYIQKFAAVTKPFIMQGGPDAIRDAVLRGQFWIGFSGRGEFFRELPRGVPIAWVVPKEGMAWTPSSIALLSAATHPNAAKLAMTWLYEKEQLQLWSNQSRTVPHPDIKVEIPEMSITAYPLMPRIPDEHLLKPNFFFKEMERVYGIR
jgi:iron(III) transport system substrate-binding protein